MTEQKDTQTPSAFPHEQRLKPRPYKLKLRNRLNIVFILLALATMVIYFAWSDREGRIAMFLTGSVAVMVKTAEVMIRLTHRPTPRRRQHPQQ